MSPIPLILSLSWLVSFLYSTPARGPYVLPSLRDPGKLHYYNEPERLHKQVNTSKFQRIRGSRQGDAKPTLYLSSDERIACAAIMAFARRPLSRARVLGLLAPKKKSGTEEDGEQQQQQQ